MSRDYSHRCPGITWGGSRCLAEARWQEGGKLYCKLHLPGRIKHAENRKRVRETRNEALRTLVAAARRFDEDAVLRESRRYGEACQRFGKMIDEARTKYGMHGAKAIYRGPVGCPDCTRTDKHIHCPECGSTEHVAENCDLRG